jgi:F-type H+-transporting ATPase subunit epsilon
MFHLQVLNPETVFFDDEVISIIAPGAHGYLGILANHAPLITSLKVGVFVITDKNNTKHYFDVSKGFMEVNYSRVAVIIDSITPREAVDIGISGGI